MNYFRQLWYDMRHQKVMMWVSISGTAISIFLVMVMFMVNGLKTVEIAPETDRTRIYEGDGLHIRSLENPERYSSSSYSYRAAYRLYNNLKGVELVSYCKHGVQNNIMVKGEIPVKVRPMIVDGNYWKMYDFNFLAGGPFTEEQCFDATKRIVLSRSIAQNIFSDIDIVGRELNMDGFNYVVSGVVEDINPILYNTRSDVWIPLDEEHRNSFSGQQGQTVMGSVVVLLKFKDNVDPKSIKEQVKARYKAFNSELAKENWEILYHGAPYSIEEIEGFIEYTEPDVKTPKRRRYMLYLVLILLPAINLSSMVRGRLQRRVSEIGVRRAYGATRKGILLQLLSENFIVTLLGGFIGLILTCLFMLFISSDFFIDIPDSSSLASGMLKPVFTMLFTWQQFIFVLGICFILNFLTATIPAWKAASVEPAVAISKSKN